MKGSVTLDFEVDKNVDEINTGFFGITIKKGELIIIGAKPGVGKSALAYSILRNVGIKDEVSSGVITTGTFYGKQLMRRLLSYESGIKFHKMIHGLLNENEKKRLCSAIEKLKKSPVFIEDFPNGSFEEIKHSIKKLVSENNVQIVFIDSFDFLDEVVNEKLSMSKLLWEYKNQAQMQNIVVVFLMDLQEDCEPCSLDMFKKDVAVTRIVDAWLFLDREIIKDYEKIPDNNAKLLYCRNNQFCEYGVCFEEDVKEM